MRIFLFFLLFSVLPLSAANVAENKPYTLNPAPNYSLCTNETDHSDLTDGKICPSGTPFWVQPGCVGWNHITKPIKITIDLGKEQVISRIRFSTGGNISGVRYPNRLDVEVSRDGQKFYRLGSLIDGNKAILPPADYGYKAIVYDSEFQTVSARYIRLRGMANGIYFFCDEIEVHDSTNRPVAIEFLPEASSDEMFTAAVSSQQIEKYSKERLRKTWSELSVKVEKLGKAPNYAAELDHIKKRIEEFRYLGNPFEFQSTLPLCDLDSRLYKLNAELLREAGYPELSVWSESAYTDISPLTPPPEKSIAAEIQMYMMNNEFRGIVLNLTSSTDHDLNLKFESGNLPVALYEVVYVDNCAMKLSPTALLPLHSEFKLPPGFTKQLYIRFHPENLPAGSHKGKLVILGAASVLEVPVNLAISPVRFPEKPRLSGGLWDYLDFRGPDGKSRGLYADQADFARRHQQQYFMDSTFAGRYRSRGQREEALAEWNIGVVPGPEQLEIAEDGRLLTRLDFGAFDKWAAAWPEAAHYFIFLSASADSKFGDAAPGTPRFNRAVAEFAAQWDAHLEEKGIEHKRVVFHLLDEPRDEATFKSSRLWVKAFKAGSKRIPVYSNPNRFIPEYKDALKDYDILSPHIGLLSGENPQAVDFFRSQTAAGRELWVYSCDEGPFSTAPWYFRRQPWVAFAVGATGSFFWAYGDSSGIPNAFNQYLSDKIYYSPVIIQRHRITGTKHFEALREGIEDYEYLCILRDLIASKSLSPAESGAGQILQEAVSAIMSQQKKALDGKSDPADFQRQKILRAIDELIKQ